MRRLLFLFSIILTLPCVKLLAQPATYDLPASIGRGNCGASGGGDSVFFFNYVTPNLTKATVPLRYKPLLKLGPTGTTNRFSLNLATIQYNPKDQKFYYGLTVYPTATTAVTYFWKWKADTSFSTSGTPPTTAFLDTAVSFPYDILGIAFDNAGVGWTLEFPPAPCRRAFLRPIDFTLGLFNAADTLDFIPGPGGIGNIIYNPGTGDITMLPNGQMYFNVDNKLYTPDYTSYGGASRHLKCTYIDTTRLPSSASALVGLAFARGDLIAGYTPKSGFTVCTLPLSGYKRIDPVTGDTNNIVYPTTGMVRSVDMTQINSGIGVAKKLISVTPTGSSKQYDVSYNVFVKNYGSVPDSNVMVRDSLGGINGNSNVSNVSLSFVGTPPPGFVLNPAYNGTSNINMLLPGGVLKNFPVDSSYFTIRIDCRLDNIDPGVIYNNSAVATCKGFTGAALRDSSTDGTNPDLNQNAKPDDLGENQPTPFVVIITPTASPCNYLDTVLYKQDFGTGVGMSATLPATPTASTFYTGANAPTMGIQRFTVTDSTHRGDPIYWSKLRDHTGDANGRMLVVNADAAATIIYRDTMPSVCPGQQYSFTFWASFIGNNFYQTLCNGLGGFRYPRFTIRVRELNTGNLLTLTQFTTDSITTNTWVQKGIKWIMPSGYSNVMIEIVNAGQGGCGNDFAIDDIQFGLCDPVPTVTTSSQAGCLGGSTTFSSTFIDAGVIPGAKDYQWQVFNTTLGIWVNIGGANAATYTINPITASDTGKLYRAIVAASGNIGSVTCQYMSASVMLTGYTQSVLPASISKSTNRSICPGKTVQLSVSSGTLGIGAKWYWYTGSCGGTLIDSLPIINVSPTTNTTYYVRAVGFCNTTACLSTTVTIACDIDKDDDGIPDFVESNMTAALADANSNTIIDAYDPAMPGFIDINYDFIDDRYQADGDVDNDGINNSSDLDFAGRVDTNSDGVDDRFDFDLDGIINMLDLDSDNDGVPDVVEAYGVDADGDGKIDNFTDTDNDGLSQNVDFNNTGANVSGFGLGRIDLDVDGYPNFTDLDSDNDGIPDIVETGASDINNNGKVDIFIDLNNDGISDSYLGVLAILRTGADTNNDGKADSYPNKNFDGQGRPNAYDMDADGDGIVDVIEAGFPDANLNGIIDGAIGTNGWSTIVSAMAGPLAIRNTDADTNRDYLDIDSDNDGITDNIEGMTTLGYLLPGTADTDGDGIVDTYDGTAGFGGSGIMVLDFDGDGTPDYRDLDTDADGMIDRIEGNDFNFNRLTDDNVTLTGSDTDGDGLDNRFDSSNIGPRVTSYNMGNGGSTFGDPAPGTRSVVQQSYGWQTDRDWRFLGLVLPVEFLQLAAVPQNGKVFLNWSVIAAKDVAKFEIERSIDNTTFNKVGTVNDAVQLNIQQSFAFADDISSINNAIIYYRIKVIGKAGETKYSNVIVVRLTQSKTPVSVSPNPTKDVAQIRFFAQKDGNVTLRLIDNLGKTVLLQNSKAAKGYNTLMLDGLQQYSAGIYTLQVLVNGDISSEKLIITK